VSSQTLTNMTLVDDAAGLPVLRPLLAWDKREVMAKAAALGILSLSELPADDACPLFAGGKQRTAVPRKDVLAAESQLELDALAEEAAARARKTEPGVMLDPLQPESRA
jgi:thiamine biosynthesis protein ThiI